MTNKTFGDMSCFPCFTSQRSKKLSSRHDDNNLPSKASKSSHGLHLQQKPLVTSSKDKANQGDDKHINAQTFTFRELATATNNFRQECLLGEGGFGRVFRGTIKTTGQVVAVKQLDRNGIQGNKEEFLSEVLTLSLLHHPNLVNLIGYCADGEQRLLVFEFMPGGSLEDHLLDITPDKNPLDWYTRIKIAFGIATGLEYLHETACPPVIYRDLKSSNVLLDDELNPKLSDFGGGKLGDKSHVSSRVMGTYGYSAPEYTRIGHVTLKSDIYSYGVVLLELITGRRAIDPTRPIDEQNLVSWAQSFFRDPKKFPDLADPLLGGQFPEKDLNQAVAIATMCLQDEPSVRPLISDVVMTLRFLATKPSSETPIAAPVQTPAPIPLPVSPLEHGESSSKHHQKDNDDEIESGSGSGSGSESEGESSGEEEEEDGDSSGDSDYEDVKSREGSRTTTTNADSKKWPSNASGSSDPSSACASDAEQDQEDEKDNEGSVSSSRASSSGASSRESSSGSKTGPVISGSRSSKSRRTHGKAGAASYRRSITRESTASSNGGSHRTRRRRSSSSYKVGARESGKFVVSRNNSEVSIGVMSACHEHSFSLGSQDGFVSLQNISSLGSMDDGSVHSSS